MNRCVCFARDRDLQKHLINNRAEASRCVFASCFIKAVGLYHTWIRSGSLEELKCIACMSDFSLL